MSWFLMWLISWLVTPSSSSRFMMASRPGGVGDGCLVRADPGGKSVGGGVVDDVDRRLGDSLTDGQRLHQIVQLQVLGGVGRHGPRDTKHQPGSGGQGVEDPADGHEGTDHHADEDGAQPELVGWTGAKPLVAEGW